MFNNLRLHLLAHGTRLSVGLVLFLNGLNKVLGSDMFTSEVGTALGSGSLHDLTLQLLPWIEMIGGVLLIIGLFTQVIAILLAIIFFVGSILLGFFIETTGISYHAFMFLVLLSLSFGGTQMGPTCDHVVEKKLRGKVEKIKV